MISVKIPQDVNLLLKTLSDNGYIAHIVGGCVRDVLMQKTPYDWDICTNALPDELCDIFKNYKLITSGIKHGTVGVIVNSVPYEITTYRTDGEYLDNRHPESVSYVSDIKFDLERRDFTINALAYNENDELIDLFGGQEDIKNKTIRAIGNPDKRFLEDALRIMRALRFSQTLGFEIEEETKTSIIKNRHLLKNIAPERINTEFSKIILSDSQNVLCDFFQVFETIFGFSKINTNMLERLKNLPKILHIRLCAYLLSCTFETPINKEFLYNLRFDKATVKNVIQIIDNFNIKIVPDITNIRLLIKSLGNDLFYDILTLKTVLSDDIKKFIKIGEIYNTIIQSDMVQTADKLTINGNDLILSGIKDGKMIGFVLDKLLDLIILENLSNEKETLLKKALEIINLPEDSK